MNLVRAAGADTGFEPTNDWTSHFSDGDFADRTLCRLPVGRTLVHNVTFDANCGSCLRARDALARDYWNSGAAAADAKRWDDALAAALKRDRDYDDGIIADDDR